MNPQAQKINQAELGVKINNRSFGLFVTPFFTTVRNIPNVQLFVNADNTTNYSLTVQYNSNRTIGIEVESKVDFTKNFSVKAVATFQEVEATRNTFWDPRRNGAADDTLIDRSGFKQNSLIFNITPSYNAGKFYSYLSWQYLGRRSSFNNVYTIPGFSRFDFGAGYDLTKKLQVSFNVNNLFNSYGIMNFMRPGDFFTILTGAEWNKE